MNILAVFAVAPSAPRVGACLSCGVAYGQPHLPSCEFRLAVGGGS